MSNISRLTTLAAAGAGGPPTEFGQAYGGGYYAGNIVNGGIEYYIIVSPKSSGQSPSALAFKTSYTAAPSATQTLNNGPAASASMNSAAYPAAQFCEALSINGYTDWYLPARDELELCYRNLKPGTGSNATNVREQYVVSPITYPEGDDSTGDTSGINRNSNPIGAAYTSSVPPRTTATDFIDGGDEFFIIDSHWSSSEFDVNHGWAQGFFNGSQGNTGKAITRQVRAIRREPV